MVSDPIVSDPSVSDPTVSDPTVLIPVNLIPVCLIPLCLIPVCLIPVGLIPVCLSDNPSLPNSAGVDAVLFLHLATAHVHYLYTAMLAACKRAPDQHTNSAVGKPGLMQGGGG
ncbi:hypothetical protein DPMN_169002 [Dreissena polymorpha]|uniref:Uncharacterized protein n=1 Tax=Dreissena polymorpha TaxID=45954 RepID=A0A9D4F1T3_DREPO|nr:hypothetical protein DPMN_169002 [Dreissena polymorpha]